MKIREVLVVGEGIPGYAVALAVAKKGIPVTIIKDLFDPHHPSLWKVNFLDRCLNYFKDNKKENGCARAMGQFLDFAQTSITELLQPDLNGDVDVYHCLEEQLRQISHVEWLNERGVIELLTLENHSLRKSDVHKKATCLGVNVYNYETEKIEQVLAKETILASGGIGELFPYSTSISRGNASGIAMAHRAGARLVNMDQVQFHALGFYIKNTPSIAFPIDLLEEGGRLYLEPNRLLEDLNVDSNLAVQLYEILLHSQQSHLWLDLTMLDSFYLQEKYPYMDSYCLHYGFNMAKDLIPVIPVVHYAGSGIHVDLNAQTTVRRLRSIGEISSTGLSYDFNDPGIHVLESLTWAVRCADDIANQMVRFVYYFPEVSEWNRPVDKSSQVLKEDWNMLRQIMWNYIGVLRDEERLKRGLALLQKLKGANQDGQKFSIDRTYLNDALETSILIAQALRTCLESFGRRF